MLLNKMVKQGYHFWQKKLHSSLEKNGYVSTFGTFGTFRCKFTT